MLRLKIHKQEDGVSTNRIWKRLLTVERTVVEQVEVDAEADVLVAHVRPVARERSRCGICRRPARGYDRGRGRGRGRWRCLDAGTMKVVLEAELPRVRCREHGVVAAAVPWARHGAGHTLVFDQQVAWMAAECSKSAVAQLMRTSWRTVGAIVERFVADRDAGADRLAGLRRIGIDEISYRKGQRYMTVVVDHDTRRVVWMADGHGRQVLQGFFDALGPERAAKLTHVSADGAEWIAETVAASAPNALRAMDPFHVVAWATEALDAERREAWNRARRQAADPELARKLKHSRHALEEPGGPDRTPAGQARLDRGHRPASAPRLPAQGGPAHGLCHRRRARRHSGDRGPGPLAVVGPPLPHRGLHRPRPPHPPPPRRDRQRHHRAPVERAD